MYIYIACVVLNSIFKYLFSFFSFIKFLKQNSQHTNSQHTNTQQEILQQQQQQQLQPQSHQQQQQQQLQQQQQHQPIVQQASQNNTSLTGAISRTPARLPEDVTALADRDNVGRDRDGNNKNAVTKTYHTLKDLISSKFKKDNNDVADELNNVVVHQQEFKQQQQQQHQHQQQQQNISQSIVKTPKDDFRMSHTPLPSHMRPMQNLNQSQPNIAQKINGNGNGTGMIVNGMHGKNSQQTLSQPQLSMPTFERQNSTDIVTDSDDGGFKMKKIDSTRLFNRRPQTMYHLSTPPSQPPPHPVSN